MTEAEIIARIQRIYEETFSAPAPPPQTDIIEAALLDSLALVALLVEVDLAFDVVLPLESLQIEDFRTIGSIARLIDEH